MADLDWDEWAIVGVVVLLVAAAGWGIWYEFEHPCLRRGPPRTCYSSICHNIGKVPVCAMTPYDCSECLERKP